MTFPTRNSQEKMEAVERLEKEKECANMKVVEMQTRMDCKEQQHAQASVRFAARSWWE